MGVWYSWLTHLPCTQESPVRIWVPPLCNNSETNDGTAVTKLIKKNKMELQDLCKRIMGLNHMGVQADNIHNCEEMHQTIRLLDNMDRYEAIRLLMHVLHVQQLQLEGAEVKYDEQNPFLDMVKFDYIKDYINSFSANMETLY